MSRSDGESSRGENAQVIKLGGSLLDLPELPRRFAEYRHAEAGPRALLVAGGGDAAEMVRRFDRLHGLDESAGHWLAVRAMRINALMLAATLPRAGVAVRVVERPSACAAAWAEGALAIMEPMAWLEHVEAAGMTVPHRWEFTSDSIAAHAAHVIGAPRLTLLKSTLPEGETVTLEAASAAGIVDQELPRAAAGLAEVELVNLRAEAGAAGWPRCAVGGGSYRSLNDALKPGDGRPRALPRQ